MHYKTWRGRKIIYFSNKLIHCNRYCIGNLMIYLRFTAIYWSKNITIYFLVCVIQCHLSHGQAQKKTTFFLIEWTHTDRNILFTFEFAGQISIKMHDCPQQRHLIGSSKSLQYRKFWPRNNMVFLCVNKQNLLLN